MIVIADTSPINYLVLIDAVHVLPLLYETIVISRAVFDELQTNETPAKVRIWVENPPSWFKISNNSNILDTDLQKLDEGEKQAIALFDQLKADALIIDDREGREEAINRGIFVIGTLGVLNAAAEKSLLDISILFRSFNKLVFAHLSS